MAPMEKPLYIPTGKRGHKMTVFCYRCKTNVSDICKETGKPLLQCPFGDKHVFKVNVYIPGEDSRKSKRLQTRDVNQAIKEAMEFEKEIKEKKNQDRSVLNERKEATKEVENIPRLLIHAIARYTAWLKNENVPAHRKKERSDAHVKDVERSFEVLIKCLTTNENNVSSLRVDQLNDAIVGQVYEYLLTEKRFSNRSLNKYLSYFTSFLKWYIEEYEVPVRNWFERVKRKRINTTPKAITKEEFELLLKQINPQNGIKRYEGKPDRYLYRSYLPIAYRLGLHTGLRREALVQLRFSDIVPYDSVHYFLRSADLKVNRIQGRVSESDLKYIFVPVTKDVWDILNEINYEEYKGTNKFLIAPELQKDRARIMCDDLSRSFSNYFDQISERKLTFKSLRKTYITAAHLYTKGDAKIISQHSGNSVIKEKYLDEEVLVAATMDFAVFKDESERKKELKQLRNNSPIKQQNLEVEK